MVRRNDSNELVINKSLSIGLFTIIVFALFFENVLIIYKELDLKALKYTNHKLELILEKNNFKEKEDIRNFMLKCIKNNVHTTNLPSLAGYKGMSEKDFEDYSNQRISLCKSKNISEADTPKEKRKRKLMWKNL